jgi:hypothetical protein
LDLNRTSRWQLQTTCTRQRVEHAHPLTVLTSDSGGKTMLHLMSPLISMVYVNLGAGV